MKKFSKMSSAGYLANHMARAFANALAAEIRPLGLSPAQFPVLLELWEADGLTQKQLVERLVVEQATMAGTLARMERDGLITRKASPNDARAQLVYLTDKARELYTPATNAAQSINHKALAGLSDKELEVFLSSMRKVIEAMR